MNNKRPVVITVAAICLAVLVVFAAGLSLGQTFGLFGLSTGPGGPGGRMGGNLPQGNPPVGLQFQGNLPQGNFPSGGPVDGTGQIPGNFDSQSGQTFQMPGGATSLFRILRWVEPVLYGLTLILGLIAAVGIWRQKKGWAILAIMLSVLLLAANVFSLFQLFSWLTFGEALLKVLLAAAVIVLLLLPAARRAYSPPAPELEF